MGLTKDEIHKLFLDDNQRHETMLNYQKTKKFDHISIRLVMLLLEVKVEIVIEEFAKDKLSISKESHYLKFNLVKTMMGIPGMKFDVMRELRLEKSDRKELLLGMVMFIQLHHAGLRKIKCYDVLETIFSN